MRCHSKGFTAPGLARRVIATTVLLVVALAILPVFALAQSRGVTTTAVVTFTDTTGRNSPLLEAKATAAAALALRDSQEFLVTASRDVEREMRSLGISPPLSTAQVVRLGRRLDVDSVTVGELMEASVDEKTGRAQVRLEIRMVDVAAEEVLDGGVSTVSTAGLPGYRGTEADALNEALRQAADKVVGGMLASRVQRGTVEMVLPSGVCEIGLGSQDGVERGMKMVVLRPIYIPDLEKVAMRKLGRLEVGEVHPDICFARPQPGVAPRTGDYVLRVYEPAVKVKQEGKKQDRMQLAAGLGALGALIAFIGIGTGDNESSPPPTPISYLQQSAMGATPVIRIQFGKTIRAWGHLLFRGHSAGFPADAPYLVEVSSGLNGEQSLKYIDDVPAAGVERDVTITVSFRDEEGDPTTEDVDITYTHEPLVAGEAYYHKVRTVTEPNFPPGTNPPLSQTGGVDGVAQNWDNTIEADYEFPMISEPSKVVGPVTFMLPAQLVSPPENAPPQNTGSITFEWNPTTGADEYVVQVFDSNDPNGLDQPVFQRAGIRPRGSGSITETWNPSSGDLRSNEIYFWRVGARKSVEITGKKGQGVPRVGFGSTEVIGYVLSSMRSFLTAPTPPPPVTTGGTEGVGDPIVATNPPAESVRPGSGSTSRTPKSVRQARRAGKAARTVDAGRQRPIGFSTRLPGQ